MRARKPKNTEWKFEEYADALVRDPYAHLGRWLEDYHPDGSEVRLDIGCGKGLFAVESALREPDALFVGIDEEPICIANALERAVTADAANAVFILGDASRVPEMFGSGEVSAIHLNFSTPRPKRKHAERRLTHLGNLLVFRGILENEGRIFVRTDSQPFFDFSLTQFALAGYEIEWETRDLHAGGFDGVQTEYETTLSERGARVHALCARKGKLEGPPVQTAPLGLVYYLPDDLDSLDYLPYGMEDTIANIKNRRARAKLESKGSKDGYETKHNLI